MMGFSGIHMDTYGFPKTAYNVHDTPPAVGKDYNDYLLTARRLICR